jgi:hypothetical protein
MPANFDYSFFFLGISILLRLDHSSSTAKALWLLYQTCHIIPQKERDVIFISLLESGRFYSLMFHWSWQVRAAFYYFYFFQLSQLIIKS